MNVLRLKATQFRRRITGLIKKFESGDIDMVFIELNGKCVAVAVSPWIIENPKQAILRPQHQQGI